MLRLFDSELTGPEIARELFVSRNTLSSHTKYIFTELGVASRRAAVLRARERGLLSSSCRGRFTLSVTSSGDASSPFLFLR